MEVYYGENGEIQSQTKDFNIPFGNTPKELKDRFIRMKEAFDRPIIDEKGKEIEI